MRWQVGAASQHVSKRELVRPGERQLALELSKRALHLVEPHLFEVRGTDDDEHGLRVREDPQDVFDHALRLMVDGDRRIVWAHGAVLHETPINACQQHGRPGKQLLTIPLRERCRGAANGDDEIRLTPREHRLDMTHHRVIGGAATYSDWLERHLDEVDGLGRRATQLWKKQLRERNMGG